MKYICDQTDAEFPFLSGAKDDQLSDGVTIQSFLESENLARNLERINQIWVDYKLSTLMIRDIFMYVDRAYVEQARVPTTYDLGLLVFRDKLLNHKILSSFIIEGILNMLSNDYYIISHTSLIKSLVNMYVEVSAAVDPKSCKSTREKAKSSISFYQKEFEAKFLNFITEECRAKRLQWISSGDLNFYCIQLESYFKQKEQLVDRCLHHSTWSPLRKILQTELLSKDITSLFSLEKIGLVDLLRESRIDDLKRLFKLFSTISDQSFPIIAETVKQYLIELGIDVNCELKFSKSKKSSKSNENNFTISTQSSSKRPKIEDKGSSKPKPVFVLWVSKIIELKQLCDNLLFKAFNGDKTFETKINEAVQIFINDNPKASQFLSLYFNEHMDKKSKLSETELETIITNALDVFRYLFDRDIFERHYKLSLAKRLLLGKTISHDIERLVLTRLKNDCGYQFTSKMEGMFNDMRVSLDLRADFAEKQMQMHQDGAGLGLELSVNVLTSSNWPYSIENSSCNIPEDLKRAKNEFSAFYLGRHSGRRLNFQFSLGNIDLKARYSSRSYEIIIHFYQAIILLLFNDNPKLSYENIKSLTNLEENELKRHLQTLACGKFRILSKVPMSREVNQKDEFTVNENFKCPLSRFRVPTVALKSSGSSSVIDEVEASASASISDSAINSWRNSVIEATIVRVMKAKRVLGHQELIVEVSRQLMSKFKPDPSNIKRRIEAMIDKEYLERSEFSRNQYRYLT